MSECGAREGRAVGEGMRSRVLRAGDGVALHVGVTGYGPDVVMLSGGPGCVNYLEDDAIAPAGVRSWYPEPRGVGRSGGGPHGLTRAVDDLDDVRRAAGVASWIVVGHSWGADLAVCYALRHPEPVAGVVAVAGTGLQNDRSWSEQYQALKGGEPDLSIPGVREVHAALLGSYRRWIREPDVFRQVADSPVPMRFVAAGGDIRPSWPLEQLAALAPHGRFVRILGVPHDFWATHPLTWKAVVTDICGEFTRTGDGPSSAITPGVGFVDEG